ncbi:MAG: hypothetical protein INH06_08115, partial [Cupriavidus sp.]|nr:hypothetical protein [Cupriavidus sp.]
RVPVKVYLLRPKGTLYWGGAGLDGDYISLTARAFQNAGVTDFNLGLTNSATKTRFRASGTILDALRAGSTLRYEDNDEWTITSGMSASAKQFNLIGYSYGSLLAAQTANFYTAQGHVVDHLILIGSPIDATFLNKLRKHRGIGKVVVMDLREHGDPIYAGMTQAELVAAAPILGAQMVAEEGKGHFYYAHVTTDLPSRLAKLAAKIVAEGVK